MKKIFLLFVIAIIQSCSINKSKTNTISGFIENNSKYFGGLPPLKGMEEALAIYKPTINQEFFIKKNNTTRENNIILSQFKTDENGNYKILLPEGIYSVFRKQKIEYAKTFSIKTQCDWLQKPDFVLVIDEKKHYKSQYTIDINPCGPLIQ